MSEMIEVTWRRYPTPAGAPGHNNQAHGPGDETMRLNEGNAKYRVTYYDHVTYHRSLVAAEKSAADLPRIYGKGNRPPVIEEKVDGRWSAKYT